MPRGRIPQKPHAPTVGGKKLRELREQAGLSLLELASQTAQPIGIAHLQRIEVGAIRQPARDLIGMLCTTLHVSYRQRRDILASFGYHPPAPLPSLAEAQAMGDHCAFELANATWPIYILDCAQRIWGWNAYIPILLGMNAGDAAMEQFRGVSSFDLAFNPAFKTQFLVDNPDEFLPSFVALTKYELSPYRDEPWYTDVIAYGRRLPGFGRLWDSVQPHDQLIASRIPITLCLDAPTAGLLKFVLIPSKIIRDSRFQVVHYVPYGAATLQQCAVWAQELGVQ